MGTFDPNLAAMDESYRIGMDVIGQEFDGKPPAPPKTVAAPVQAAKPAPPPEDTGPGFWSRLGSGIASVAGNTVDAAASIASRVTIAVPISGARANAAQQLVPPRQEPPWAMILGAGAALLVLVALLRRP